MGSSSWLTTLPLSEHGFSLHKGAFQDAVCPIWLATTFLLPSGCMCGKQFAVEYAFGCPCRGLPKIRHD